MDARRVAGWILVALGAAGLAGIAAVAVAQLASGILLGAASLLLLPFAAALPLALLLVGRRILRPRPIEPGGVAPSRPPVPMPPVEDAAALRGPVSACPDCGYLGIRMPTIGDGLWPGGGELGDRMVCPRCDWQGLPVRFDDPQDYRAWLSEMQT